MKTKLLLLSALCSAQLFSQITVFTPYCDGSFAGGFIDVPHAITRVQLNTLDNNSGSTQYVTPHYVFYNNLTSTSLLKGSSQTLPINHDDGTTIHGIAAWIDFNQDNDFDDSGEKVGETLWPGDDDPLTGTSVVYPFTVPTGSVTGNTRMRVRVYEDDVYTFSGTDLPVLPCYYTGNTSYDWGETEDYSVTITAPSTNSMNELENDFSLVFSESTISIYNQSGISKIQLVNMLGLVVSESYDSMTILFSNTEKGLYLLIFHDDKGIVFSKKINI